MAQITCVAQRDSHYVSTQLRLFFFLHCHQFNLYPWRTGKGIRNLVILFTPQFSFCKAGLRLKAFFCFSQLISASYKPSQEEQCYRSVTNIKKRKGSVKREISCIAYQQIMTKSATLCSVFHVLESDQAKLWCEGYVVPCREWWMVKFRINWFFEEQFKENNSSTLVWNVFIKIT